MPNWALFILFPFFSLAVLAVMSALFRLVSKQLGFHDFDPDILDTATQNAMSGAYVVLGFVLVMVMSTTNEIDANMAKETSQIERLDRLLILEGSPASQIARKTLQAYTQSIIDDDWRKLSLGTRYSETRGYSNKLFDNLKAIEPKDSLHNALWIDIIKTNEELNQYRSLRMLSSKSRLPSLFWQVNYLTLFGVIAIAALRLLNPSGIRVTAIVIQLVMISLLFATVMILDMPYIGQERSSPEAFEFAVQLLQSR